jgi:hypothetical protein
MPAFPTVPRTGYADRVSAGEPVNWPEAKRLLVAARDAIETAMKAVDALTVEAKRLDPETAGHDLADMLDTLQSLDYDANYGLGELHRAWEEAEARGETSYRPGADLANHMARVA